MENIETGYYKLYFYIFYEQTFKEYFFIIYELKRQFMLVDGDDHFITLRTEPTLVKIKLSLHNQNEIWFNTENFDTLKIRVKESAHQNEDFIDTK